MTEPVQPQPPLLIVVGPTAAGKSDLALELAQALDGEVISADSVQVYRYFDIGTGKLPLEERAGVPHHLIDVVEPDEAYSAARFVEMADEAARAINERQRLVVVAGGTGLYVKALLHGLFKAPPADAALRDELRADWETDPQILRDRLRQVDPQAADRIEPNDFVRISRALEVYTLIGRPISELQQDHAFSTRRYPALVLGLQHEREILRDRIDRRVEAMMAQGWLAEVEGLMQRGYAESHPMGALGYRQLKSHLEGSLDLAEAVRQTKRDTWRFARRQLNWFSSDPSITWYKDRAEVDQSEVRQALRELQAANT